LKKSSERAEGVLSFEALSNEEIPAITLDFKTTHPVLLYLKRIGKRMQKTWFICFAHGVWQRQ
jgi:hypothetical protein